MTAVEIRISDWSSDVCSSDLRLLTGGSRREQLALPIKITLRVPGDGQGLIEGLLRLRNLLRPQPAAQFVEVCLCGRYGGVGGRERFLERLRVESRHMCARLDMIAFIEQHLRDAAGLAEGQLHLPDVDIAVQIEGVALAAAPLPPQPSSTADQADAPNDQDHLSRAATP